MSPAEPGQWDGISSVALPLQRACWCSPVNSCPIKAPSNALAEGMCPDTGVCVILCVCLSLAIYGCLHTCCVAMCRGRVEPAS